MYCKCIYVITLWLLCNLGYPEVSILTTIRDRLLWNVRGRYKLSLFSWTTFVSGKSMEEICCFRLCSLCTVNLIQKIAHVNNWVEPHDQTMTVTSAANIKFSGTCHNQESWPDSSTFKVGNNWRYKQSRLQMCFHTAACSAKLANATLQSVAHNKSTLAGTHKNFAFEAYVCRTWW